MGVVLVVSLSGVEVVKEVVVVVCNRVQPSVIGY